MDIDMAAPVPPPSATLRVRLSATDESALEAICAGHVPVLNWSAMVRELIHREHAVQLERIGESKRRELADMRVKQLATKKKWIDPNAPPDRRLCPVCKAAGMQGGGVCIWCQDRAAAAARPPEPEPVAPSPKWRLVWTDEPGKWDAQRPDGSVERKYDTETEAVSSAQRLPDRVWDVNVFSPDEEG